MPDLTVGCHLSLGRQPRLSIQEAYDYGARCFQIFASSPAAWKLPRIREDSAAELRSVCAELGTYPVVIHSIYLINLASDNVHFVDNSRGSLIGTLRAAPQLDASAVITHIGSHGGRTFAAVASDVAEQLLKIVDDTPSDVTLALENSAGSGGIIGSTLEELSTLLDLAKRHPRLKVVLDTAHLCAGGWDFTVEGEASRLVEEIENSLGLDRLLLIHANDSKLPPGSRRDRHAPIGEGYIALEGFRSLLAQPDLASVPWILETPDLESTLETGQRFRSLSALHRLAPGALPKEVVSA
ncbi:MAG TPA: deoxyribonuclease IV [Dehalococcoidia bacterium]